MNKGFILRSIGLMLLVLASFHIKAQTTIAPGRHQPTPQDPGDCPYHYVEQMPSMLKGGGYAAIANEIGRTVKVPLMRPQQPWRRTVVYFVVGAKGNVYREKVVKSSGVTAYDEALLVAVRALPRLLPGRQNGVAVSVGITLPVQVEVR